MVEEPQSQGGLDGEIRVQPLPAPPAAPAGCPGSDRLRGQPHRHIATSNEGFVVGSPVRNAILRLIPGMNLRLHPCSVAPAKRHEKYGPNHPTRSGSSCNNARPWRDDGRVATLRACWSSTATTSRSGAGARCGAPRVRRPGHVHAGRAAQIAAPPTSEHDDRHAGIRRVEAERARQRPQMCVKGNSDASPASAVYQA